MAYRAILGVFLEGDAARDGVRLRTILMRERLIYIEERKGVPNIQQNIPDLQRVGAVVEEHRSDEVRRIRVAAGKDQCQASTTSI